MVAGRALLLVFQFISLPVFNRVLGPGSYGVLMFIAVVKMNAGLLDLGLPVGGQQSQAALFHTSQQEAWKSHRCNLYLSLVVGLTGLILLSVFGPIIGIPKHSPAVGDIRILYVLSGAQFFFEYFRNALNAPHYARERFGNLAILQSVVPAGCAIINVAAVLIWRTPTALATGWVFEALAGILVSVYLIRKGEPDFPLMPKFDRGYAIAIFHIGIRTLSGSFASRIGGSADKLIIGWILGPTQLAYYTYACRIPQVIQEMLTRITDSVVPEMTRMRNNARVFSDLARRNSLIILTVGAPAILVVCGFGDSILRAWMRKEIPAGAPVCALMAGYFTIELLYGAITRTFLAKNTMHYLMGFAWFNALATMFLTGPFARRFGIVGGAHMNLGIDLVQLVPIIWLTTRVAATEVKMANLLVSVSLILGVSAAFCFGGYWLTTAGPLVGHPYAGVILAPLFAAGCLLTLVYTRIGLIPERVLSRFRLPAVS